MAATMKLSVRCVFADDTTQTITIDGINPNTGVAADIKSRVINFNDQKGGTLATKMKSKNGFNWIGINRVTTTTTDRTYIF